jgi:hypothetical protein
MINYQYIREGEPYELLRSMAYLIMTTFQPKRCDQTMGMVRAILPIAKSRQADEDAIQALCVCFFMTSQKRE